MKLSSQQPLVSKQKQPPFQLPSSMPEAGLATQIHGGKPWTHHQQVSQMASSTPWWRHSLQWHHLQRVFSSFGLVLTKLCNKLGLQKAAKLVLIFRISRGPKELDYYCELDILNTKLNFCGHWTLCKINWLHIHEC